MVDLPFISLQKIKKTNPKEQALKADILVDLIWLNDKTYFDSFYHSLRDTAVCKWLVLTNEIAFQRKFTRRVVTEDGK